MGNLVRCISNDGTLTVMAVNSTDIVERAQQIHETSAVCSADHAILLFQEVGAESLGAGIGLLLLPLLDLGEVS